MINVEMCRDCGRPTYVMAVTNLTVRCDVEPLDAQTAVAALLVGRQPWRVKYTGSTPSSLSPARPEVMAALRIPDPAERPLVVAEHECKASRGSASLGTRALEGRQRPVRQSTGPTGPPTPPGPPVDQPATLSAPQAASSTPGSANAAETPAFEIDWDRVGEPPAGPRCDGCAKPCADGTYAAVELGDLVLWAHHVYADDCQAEDPSE